MLNKLSLHYVEQHPEDAARDIERMNKDDTLLFFTDVAANTAADVLVNMTPVHCIEILSTLNVSVSINILESIPANIASSMIRRMNETARRVLLELARKEARLESARMLVNFSPNTVGSIMDPQVLILQKSMNMDEVKHVLRCHVKELPDEFYVVDERQVLCGYVAARDLLLKENFTNLMEFIRPCQHTIPSTAYIDSACNIPAWLEHSRLPVVGINGVLLGELDNHVLQIAVTKLKRRRSETDLSNEILLGLTDTFVNSFVEVISVNKQQRPAKFN